MSVPEPSPDSRQLLRAALPAGVLVAVGTVFLALLRAVSPAEPADIAGISPAPVLLGVLTATVTFVPFLVAVLLVVADPSRRSVAGAVALVYVVDLVVAIVGSIILTRAQIGFDLTVLAVPLPRVTAVVAVAAAVWLADDGGYERLAAVAGNATQHPLFAQVADQQLRPGLTLQRGLVAAAIAGVVGAGGLLVAGGVQDFLGVVTRLLSADSPDVLFPRGELRGIGIPPARLPGRWLYEASFLLGVLFITGPRLSARDLLKGVAVVFGVQSAMSLVPMVVPPFDPGPLLGTPGPVVTPLRDVFLLVGIAVAVRSGLHGQSESPAERPTGTADS